MGTYARIGFTGEKHSGWYFDPGESHESGAESFLIKHFDDNPENLVASVANPFVSISVIEYASDGCYYGNQEPIKTSTLITSIYSFYGRHIASDIISTKIPEGYDMTMSKKFCFYKKP